jgi:hypothetical protein
MNFLVSHLTDAPAWFYTILNPRSRASGSVPLKPSPKSRTITPSVIIIPGHPQDPRRIIYLFTPTVIDPAGNRMFK